MRPSTLLASMVIALASFGAAPERALSQSVEDFYKGKTVNVLIGFGPGGSNDAWARALANHMGKHIPGNPTLVAQNMPGAGTLRLTNHLYNVAPKDGTVFGLISRGVPLEPLLGGQNAEFDPLKMNWIGSPDQDVTVCAARKDAPVQTLQDLTSKELVVGGTGSGADSAIYPVFLSEFLDLKFKTVKGYPGSSEILLAVERGEVQGICIAYESLARQTVFQEKMRPLFQAGLKKAQAVPASVPLVSELAKSPEDRKALELFLARAALGRPFVAPPGVPADRVEALRRAFEATMKDPEFLAEVKKLRLDPDPISGQELEETIGEIYKTPPQVVQRVTGILGRITSDKK